MWGVVQAHSHSLSRTVARRLRSARSTPSADQIAYARSRPAGGNIAFQEGDALASPFDDATFDVAVATLVIFFVPDRVKGAAEMKRVAKPGGTVATWDGPGRRLSMRPLYDALESMEVVIVRPPGFDDSSRDRLAMFLRPPDSTTSTRAPSTSNSHSTISMPTGPRRPLSQAFRFCVPFMRSQRTMWTAQSLAERQIAAGPGRSRRLPGLGKRGQGPRARVGGGHA
jgi:SAM-dependent methyltransferase